MRAVVALVLSGRAATVYVALPTPGTRGSRTVNIEMVLMTTVCSVLRWLGMRWFVMYFSCVLAISPQMAVVSSI